MPNLVKGSLDSECRVLILNEADMVLDNSSVFSAGEWELIVNSVGSKTVIARETATGEAYGYGSVTPIYDVLPLAINSEGDVLAINAVGDHLIAEL